MTNGNQKGKRGERELAAYLTERGHPARRGQQFKGGADSPDVVCPSLPVHWECKRVERLRLPEAMAQAIDEAAPGKLPVVAHRRNGGDWLAIMRLDDLLELMVNSND